MVTPVFDLEQTLSTSYRLIRRASAIWALHMLKMRWIISPYTVKQAIFDLQQKETGSKTVAIATSKYASCGVFLIITCRDILYFVFWLPYCHTLWHHQYLICIIQKLLISLERYEIWQKGKHHSSSLLKAFQIHLFLIPQFFIS